MIDEPDDMEHLEPARLGRGYRKGQSVADLALGRIGDDDVWSKSTLCKVAVVRLWRRFKSFLLGMLPAFVRTKLEPKPPFND